MPQKEASNTESKVYLGWHNDDKMGVTAEQCSKCLRPSTTMGKVGSVSMVFEAGIIKREYMRMTTMITRADKAFVIRERALWSMLKRYNNMQERSLGRGKPVGDS